MIYFGCNRQAGHFFFDEHLRTLRLQTIGIPFDGQYCPELPGQPEGKTLHHTDIEGNTVIAFWDRSIDSRPGSNSAFIAPGYFDFHDMVKFAEEAFPTIWKRFTFPIVDVTDEFFRGSGDCICKKCGQEYRRHKGLCAHTYDWLKVLCDGRLVKL